METILFDNPFSSVCTISVFLETGPFWTSQ